MSLAVQPLRADTVPPERMCAVDRTALLETASVPDTVADTVFAPL